MDDCFWQLTTQTNDPYHFLNDFENFSFWPIFAFSVRGYIVKFAKNWSKINSQIFDANRLEISLRV